MHKKNSVFFVIVLFLAAFSSTYAQPVQEGLKNWPKGSSPQEVGKRVTERFIAVPHPNFGSSKPTTYITYPEVCAWYGGLTFADLSKNKSLKTSLIQRFQPLFKEEASFVPVADHVDYSVFGAVPLEIYRQTKERPYLELGKAMADKQWGPPEGPRVTPESHTFHSKGFSWQTRLWIDDMYMITILQAQAYRATGEPKYIERTAKEMVMYLAELQRPNGLFYHAPDVPFYWGRGNGWMAAGMSELLTSLPKDNPDRPKIMEGYQKMMASLLKYQAPNGMWRQLVDDPESWEETSCTGMFTFAFITGVKNGWLDKKTYEPAARKGWLGLVAYLDEKAEVREVCQGTNKTNDRQFYLDRKRLTGDMHGQAPILWCASALLR